MPSRQFSAAIIGGVWPQTDPQNFQSAAEAQRAKGVALLRCADTVRSEAAGVSAEQSGRAVDGFVDECHRDAATYTSQADRYFAIERVCQECSRLTYGLREDLDHIDANAHDAIKRVEDAISRGYNAYLGGVAIMEIIATAREHGVPIEHNPALAEALATIELDDEIPEPLYRAVAEILAYILRTSGHLK